METWLDSVEVYSGRIVGLRTGRIRMENGTEATREVVEHPGGAAVIPVLDDAVLLARQYRIAIGREILEIPAGKLEPGAAPEAQARQELEEEIGYRAGRLVPVGCIYTSVGYTSEKVHLFLAFDLEQVGQNLEFDEQIEVVAVPVNELETRLANLEFEDAKTFVGLSLLLEHTRGRLKAGPRPGGCGPS